MPPTFAPLDFARYPEDEMRRRARELCAELRRRRVIFGEAYGRGASGRKITHYYVQESVGIAAGLLIAAVHHAGLASLTHTPSPMGFLGRILDRPENERPFLILVVGYPADDAHLPVITKKPFDRIVSYR